MMIDLQQVQNGINRINDVDVILVSIDQRAVYMQQLRHYILQPKSSNRIMTPTHVIGNTRTTSASTGA